MTPNILLHSSFGKILFGACDILVALLLRSVDTPSDSTNARISLLSLFNPLIFSISTRGSSESILGALVLLTLNYAMKERWDATAIWFGVAVHWKIYPFIYGSSLLMLLTAISRGGRGDFGIMRMLRFAFISGGTFLALGVVMYAM
jgi:GPI mannosyltransferase 1 subunit M